MVDDQIPSFLEDEVRSRIASRGTESTFVVDESSEEVIVSHTGFTNALKREYRNACEERNEEEIKVYHLTKGDGRSNSLDTIMRTVWRVRWFGVDKS